MAFFHFSVVHFHIPVSVLDLYITDEELKAAQSCLFVYRKTRIKTCLRTLADCAALKLVGKKHVLQKKPNLPARRRGSKLGSD